MVADDVGRARRAALLLHSLKPATQRRALDKLRAPEVARLQPLLDELARLGISPTLSHRLQSLVEPVVTAARDLTLHERVKALAAADVAQCLQSCAPTTIAQLLLADEWPWKPEVLDAMPELCRAEVVRHMRSESLSPAPAVLRWLCERLCKDVDALHVSSSESRSEPLDGFRKALKRLLRWTR